VAAKLEYVPGFPLGIGADADRGLRILELDRELRLLAGEERRRERDGK